MEYGIKYVSIQNTLQSLTFLTPNDRKSTPEYINRTKFKNSLELKTPNDELLWTPEPFRIFKLDFFDVFL